ncbi:UNVERIFIED_CONTAM: hypothetical protein H355_001955 [Colinus virginianus]|nr:hypothetical protein H355_001955 [Colinus virginianus]
MGIPPEEYWIRSGAKPKFTGQIHGSPSPQAKSEEQVNPAHLSVFQDTTGVSLGCPPLVKPKKRVGKPPLKRRDTRCEVEDVEVWEMPKRSVRKGW